MKLLSIEYIPGVDFEPLGIVKGTVVQTKNIGRDFMAGMKTLVGGEIVGYTEMLNEARQIATKRMVDEAKEMDVRSSRSDRLWNCGEIQIKMVKRSSHHNETRCELFFCTKYMVKTYCKPCIIRLMDDEK